MKYKNMQNNVNNLRLADLGNRSFFNLKTTMLSFMAMVFIVMVAFADCCALPIDEIGPLTELEDIKNHYQVLSTYSGEAREEEKPKDKIRFPNKKNQMIIKLFQPEYLTRPEINDMMLKLKHPANSSVETQEELKFLLDLQESRTEAEVLEALRLHEIGYFPVPGLNDKDDLFFEVYEVLGDQISYEEYPQTVNILHNVMKEVRIMEFEAKNHILRARPRQLSAELQPLKKMKTSSFASGHTLWAYMQAYVLAELIPSKKREFLDLAYEIGYSREILGVHYPSDEEAARVLAHHMLSNMWDRYNFKLDFTEAKKEWSNIDSNLK